MPIVFRTGLFIFLLSSKCLLSQLTADAGSDLYLCDSLGKKIPAPISLNKNFYLGGNPSAIGGIKPYKYAWKFEFKTSLQSKPFLYAKDILNDTTDANPKLTIFEITNPYFGSLNKDLFYVVLEVTDSVGNKSRDSLLVSYSQYVYTAVSHFYKSKYDTIQISSNIKKGKSPVRYSWSPNKSLIDTNSVNPRTYVSSSIFYMSYAVDSFGCKASDGIDVVVNTNSISSVNSPSTILNFHNPISDNSIFKINSETRILQVEVYNDIGQKLSTWIKPEFIHFGSELRSRGNYYLWLYKSDGNIEKIRLIR